MEPKTRGILYKILGVAVGFVVGYVVVYSLFGAFSGGDDKVLRGLQTVSQEVNKSCPMQVDAYTVLKATSVLPPRTLRYHYTLTLPEGFDLETSKEGFISVVKNQVRTQPDMQELRDIGTVFSYSYDAADGTHIFDFEVTPADYD